MDNGNTNGLSCQAWTGDGTLGKKGIVEKPSNKERRPEASNHDDGLRTVVE